jgi:hypothetical protein
MTRGTFKHGLTDLPEYRAWQTMRLRCLNPENKAFKNYGGRGITVCDRWKDNFLAFLRDMGRKPSSAHELDRIDNNKGYEPGNCRWVTRIVNSRNRRSNKWVEFKGERRLLIDVCEQFGIRSDTVRFRLKHGMTLEQAVATPVRPKSPKGQAKKPEPKRTDYYLSPEVKSRVVELAKSGLGSRRIRKITGVSRTHIARLVKGRR